MNNKAAEIAERVKTAGGRAYFVGGFVRDKLLGIESKDMDIEVHGLDPDVLFSILKDIGEPLSFGESFGIFSLKGENIDIALPRKEHAVGKGHRDFEVSVDPFIGCREAAGRRDFTVNSLMEDVLTGEIIDSFGGREDIDNKVLRHVDCDSFSEDPLRALRCARFASRFGFSVHPDTMAICRNIDLASLSKERIEGELKKAMLEGIKPSVFFEVLRNMKQLDCWFPELKSLIDLEQDPVFHPEGDVWTHTMEVLDRGAEFRNEVSSPFSFMLLCLTHDFGKIVSTENINGRIHAYGHESIGLPIAEEFLKRITNDREIISYVLNMIPLHMKPNMVAYSKSAVKTTNRMFDEALSQKDLIYFSMADKPVVSGTDPYSGDPEFLWERLRVYEETMSKPFVTGKDLVAAGFVPGDYFSDVLEYAHKLRLAGIEKENALKQTVSYAKKKGK